MSWTAAEMVLQQCHQDQSDGARRRTVSEAEQMHHMCAFFEHYNPVAPRNTALSARRNSPLTVRTAEHCIECPHDGTLHCLYAVNVSPRDSRHRETSRHRDAIRSVLPRRSPETYSINTNNSPLINLLIIST